MPRHFSEKEKEAIRQDLLDTAKLYFEKYGLDKTNIEDITRKVGISKGSFYSFFNSKGDIFFAAYVNERIKAQNELFRKYDGYKGTMQHLIVDFAKDYQYKIDNSPLLNMVYEPRGFSLITDNTVEERLNKFNEETNLRLTDKFQQWMNKRGNFNISAELIIDIIRSTNFLKFHVQAIGYDAYERVVSTIIEATSYMVEESKD